MIDIIWFVIILASIVYGLFSGSAEALISSIGNGAFSAIKISAAMCGTMAFWMGITQIAEDCGITYKINKLVRKPLSFLFPEYKNNKSVMEKISLNVTSNLLGLSNAATPLGISAMNEMKGKEEYPSDSMILFVVINTTSIQIIPTQIAALRTAYGSTAPFSIMPHILLCSFISCIICIMLCKICSHKSNHLYGRSLI